MARLKNGILGGISGAVGPVVGCSWKGIEYIRSKPRKKKKRAPSEKQIAARSYFRYLTKWLNNKAEFFALSFQNQSINRTGLNVAYTLNCKALGGIHPNYEPIYANIVITEGELPGIKDPAVDLAEGNILQLRWTSNVHEKGAKRNDTLVVLVNSGDNKYAEGTVNGAERSKESYTLALNVPEDNSTALHIWVSFMSADKTKAARSQYMGNFQTQA